MNLKLQTMLNEVDNTPVRIMVYDLHSLIKMCFQLIGPHNLIGTSTYNGIPSSTMNTLIKPIQTAIETQAALIKSIQEYQTKFAQDENSSNLHAATNDKQLYDSIQGILTKMEGMKKDVADMKTHFGNQASIVDTIQNQVEANSKEATSLRALVKDHIATKHHELPNPIVVYGWLVQPYELGIRTKTSVPSAGHTYEYKYTMNNVETSITASDANLKVGTELGTLTYTPLNKNVSKVVIEQTS